MVRRLLPTLIVGLALLGLGPPGLGASAYAQGCLSAGDARAAVASGQVVPLSRILGQLRQAAGGEILPGPQLCKLGGQFVYFVNVLSPDGAVKRLTVDAASGNILGY